MLCLVRPFIQDRYPVLGFTDVGRTVYVASMHPAVTCAATIGRLVSEELYDVNVQSNPAVGEIINDARVHFWNGDATAATLGLTRSQFRSSRMDDEMLRTCFFLTIKKVI